MRIEEYIIELQNDIEEIEAIIEYSKSNYIRCNLLPVLEKKKYLLKWLEEYKMLKENMEDDLK